MVYFDYAGESDVPPKLDIAVKYSLMQDIVRLYCHLHGVKYETMVGNAADSLLEQGDQVELVETGSHGNKMDAGHVTSYNGVTLETYTQTSSGNDLFDAITSAKTFFKENPDWIGQILEPISGKSSKSKNKDKSKLNQNENQDESGENSDDNSESEKQDGNQGGDVGDGTGTGTQRNSRGESDPVYQERRKRRMKEEELQLDFIPRDVGKQTDGQNEPEVGGDVIGNQPISSPGSGTHLHNDTSPFNHSVSTNQEPSLQLPNKVNKSRTTNPNDGDILRMELGINSPNQSNRRRNSKQTNFQKLSSENSSVDSLVVNSTPTHSNSGDNLDDDLQLQKDIDFIKLQKEPGGVPITQFSENLSDSFVGQFFTPGDSNPDNSSNIHQVQVHNVLIPPFQNSRLDSDSPSDLDLDPIRLDLADYTPPADFISLVTEQEKNKHLMNGDIEKDLENFGRGGLNNSSFVIIDTPEKTGSTQDATQEVKTQEVAAIFDSNANKMAVPARSHFVIDFVDPSVKQKPEDLDFNTSNL